MSTWSTNLKIELIGTGEQPGTWGTTTNTNLGTALEQAIVGKADVTMSSASVTLNLTNTNALQDARALYLNLTGSPGGAAVLNVPAIQKPYIVKNGSDQQVTIKVAGQTGVAIPTSKTALVYNNGTDVTTSVDYIPSLTLGAALPAASGGTGNTSYTIGDILYASTSTTLSKLADVATGNALISGGVATAPSWGKIGLTTHVSGVLPIANGGTNSSSTTYCNLTTNVTGTLPVANGGTGITSFGTGVATALGQNVTGSGGIALATSPVLTTPNIGTPSAGTLTNCTGLPISTGVSGLGTGVATFLATPTSANLATAVTNETGSGSLVFATSPTLVTPLLGTPTSGTLTNCTGLPLSTGVTGTLAVANGGTGQTTYTNGQLLIGNTTGNTLTKATLTAGTGITITNGTGSITIAGNTGTVTSVGGTGTVNGITLTGTVTSTGNLTLGGTLSGVNLTTQVTGTLPVGNGGSGATTLTGVLKGNGTSAFTASNVNLASEVTGTLPVANGGTGTTSTTYCSLTTNVTGTLPVANGGTGLATLTANNVLLGNGTSAVQVVAPSTSGNVLKSNGTTWTSSAPGQLQYELYTSGTTTWTCPAGVTRVRVICIGGGGGGSEGNSGKGAYSGGTGGYGGVAVGIYTVTPGTGYSVVVGAGGAGNNSGAGSNGNPSSFGSTICSATGGTGGGLGGNDGTPGVGSGGVTANSNVAFGTAGVFAGPTSRARAASSTAALTWSTASVSIPGAGGQGELNGSSTDAVGGVGGAVYLEYIG